MASSEDNAGTSGFNAGETKLFMSIIKHLKGDIDVSSCLQTRAL